MKNVFLALVMFLSLTAAAFADVTIGQPAPNFTLTDVSGQARSLSDYKGQFVVLEWLNPDCPFVKKHYESDNMQALQKKSMDKGVVWLTINSSAAGKEGNYPPEQLKKLLEDQDSHPTALFTDSDGTVGKLYGAKTTPHMFVVNPEGNVVYQGAIDSVPSADKEDVAGAQNYVQAALDEAMAGKAVSAPTTKSYGCSVKY